MSKNSYSQFNYSPTVSDNAVFESIENRQIFYAPTGSEHQDSEQFLATYTTTPLNQTTDKSILRFMAWSDDPGRPENEIIDAYLANELGANVISVQMPGVSNPSWRDEKFVAAQRITPEQKETLNNGRYSVVGGAVLAAAIFVDKQLRGENHDEGGLVLVASSMGVATAAGALGAAVASGNGSRVKGVVLGEGVNYKPRHLRDLAGNFVAQSGANESLAQNPERLQEANEGTPRWLIRVALGARANFAYFTALPEGRFSEDVGDLGAISKSGLDIPVLIHSGESSRLSPLSHNQDTTSHFSAAGVNVERWVYPGVDHPYTMALGSMIDTSRQVL